MSRALPGEHYCLVHQGNHSHYATHNCTVCKLTARIAELEAQLTDRPAAADAGGLSVDPVLEAFKELVRKHTHRRPRIIGNDVEYRNEIDTYQIGREAIDIAYSEPGRPAAVMAARHSIDDDGHFSALLGNMHPLSKQAVIAFVDENTVPRPPAMGAGGLSPAEDGAGMKAYSRLHAAMYRVFCAVDDGKRIDTEKTVKQLYFMAEWEVVRAALAARPTASGAGDLSTKQGKLLALADRIDHEQLWRRPGLERFTMTDEQRDRMDAAVNLRRYADIWTPGHWVIVPPTGGVQFGASTLDKAVEMAKRERPTANGAAGQKDGAA